MKSKIFPLIPLFLVLAVSALAGETQRFECAGEDNDTLHHDITGVVDASGSLSKLEYLSGFEGSLISTAVSVKSGAADATRLKANLEMDAPSGFRLVLEAAADQSPGTEPVPALPSNDDRLLGVLAGSLQIVAPDGYVVTTGWVNCIVYEQ